LQKGNANEDILFFFANFGRNENGKKEWEDFLLFMKGSLNYSLWDGGHE